MVDQIAVDASVSILKRMNVNEPERQRGGGDDSIETLCRSPVERRHALDQRGKILRTRADMVRQRLPRVTVMLADKTAFLAQAKLHKPRVSDHDGL
jgi:hypothetical protein